MNLRILLVEGDPVAKRLIAVNLLRAGYEVAHAANVAEAKAVMTEKLPDLALLECVLPDGSGVGFTRRLRADKHTGALPVILLSAPGRECDTIGGLEAGADDFLLKPVYARELLARIKAVMRRCTPKANDNVLEVAGLRCDPVHCRITANGNSLAIGGVAFRLLRVLMTGPGRVYSRAQLLNEVWRDVSVAERTVDVHIRGLRQALAMTGHARLLQAVRGAGYRFSSGLPERGP
ncbi:MAG: DNA-binding response regulator [Betaproteobacteria bacterium]|nr:DNA-binding response regulator [Betaproteobacteria bacterium]